MHPHIAATGQAINFVAGPRSNKRRLAQITAKGIGRNRHRLLEHLAGEWAHAKLGERPERTERWMFLHSYKFYVRSLAGGWQACKAFAKKILPAGVEIFFAKPEARPCMTDGAACAPPATFAYKNLIAHKQPG